MIAPKRRLTNHALHGREEWFKRIFRDQIAEAAGILEVVLSGIVLAALLMSIVPLVELMPAYRSVTLGIYALYPTRKFVPPKVRALVDFLAERFATPPPGW